MAFSKKIIDLSHHLSSSTQIYPSNPVFCCTPLTTHAKEGCSVQNLSLCTHTGTHIDAPLHFFPNARAISDVPLNQLIAEAVLIDLSNSRLTERQRIEWADFAPYADQMREGRIVLINTGWSKAHYGTDRYLAHPYLAPGIARELLQRGVRVVGTDTINPDQTPFRDGTPGVDGFKFHEAFLGQEGIIAENLTNSEELAEAQRAGGGGGGGGGGGERWIVSIVPLKIIGGDGSPVRAFAFSVPK